MKKVWNIDRNNLILRMIVTYLGTRGTTSVLEIGRASCRERV